MAKLQLSFACGLYDRMQPLYTGEVTPDGIDLNFIAIDQPRPIFDRMSGGEEFDVSEYSLSEFSQRFTRKECPFVAIPVFPSIAFRMGYIAINKKSGIKTPRDLEGKRIGVPLYTMTAAIFSQCAPPNMLSGATSPIHSAAVFAATIVTQRIAMDPRSCTFPPLCLVRVAIAM